MLRTRETAVHRKVNAKLATETKCHSIAGASMSSETESIFELLSLAPELAVLVCDSDGVIKDANRPACQYLELELTRIQGAQFWALFTRPGNQLPMSFTDFANSALAGEPLLRTDSPDEALTVQARLLDGRSGLVAVSLHSVRKSSRSKDQSTNQNPSQSDLMLSAAEKISGFGCFSWDMNNDILQWSDGLLHIFGVERSAFSGKGEAFFNRIHPDDQAKIGEAIAEAARQDGMFQNTERIKRPDGEIRWLESKGRLITSPDGKPSELIGICRDITESINNANELRRQIDDRKSLEMQLLQAQKVEAIGKLTSGIAHDFNNLLTVISSGCELLDLMPENALSAQARSLVQSIQDAGDRASRLTDQLLLYSRSSPRQPRAVDLNVAIDKSREFLARLLGKSIQLSLSLAPTAPVVRIDPTHLQQILLNLAVNARDAMPTGGRLTIATNSIRRSQVPPHDGSSDMTNYAVLQVTDSGSGISDEVQTQIFEPFFTTKPVGSGTGLGLSVVDGIVHAGGGFIEVKSNMGHGTDFFIFLPQVANDAELNPEPPISERERNDDKRTVLIVEDEPAVLQMVSSAFRQAGYQVIGIKDPADAVRFVAQSSQSIDLLVTDVSMPVLSGPELVKTIQGDNPEPPFPVLYISGNDLHALENTHGLRTNEQNFIQKPFRISALLDKTHEILSTSLKTISFPEPGPQHG